MPDQKISSLPAVTGISLLDADKFVVVASGVTSSINKAEMAAVFGAGAGGGEINTSSNAGTGLGLALPKVGVNLPFKSLIAGTNVTLTDNGNDVTVDAAGVPAGTDRMMQFRDGAVFGGAVNLQYNKTTGNLSVGGGVPAADALLTVEATRANEKIAFINNTSPSGYGLRVQTGDDTKYGLKVSDAGGAGYLQLLGKQVMQFGKETSTHFTALTNSSLDTTFTLEADAANSGGGHDAVINLISDTTGVDAGTAAMGHRIAATGDQGLRIDYNYSQINDAWGVGYGHYTRLDKPTVQLSIEKTGALGIAYVKAPNDAASAYDAAGGKVFIFYPQGVNYSNSTRLANATMVIANPGRGFSIAMDDSDVWSTVSSYTDRFKIESKYTAQDGTAVLRQNPTWIFVGGSLKNVQVDGNGFLKAF